MKTAIINWENAYENDLARETMEICEIDDVLAWFEGDPDQLRINGKTVLFIDIQNPEHTRQTVIYNGVDSFDLYYNRIESTNENMKNLKNGIAYRGGKGYTYSLYTFKN